MRRAFAALALILLAAVLGSATAGASDSVSGAKTAPAAYDPSRTISYSDWRVDGTRVRLRFTLPIAAARALNDPDRPPPRIADIAKQVHDQLLVRSAGADCPPLDQGEGFGEIYTLALTPGVYRFEMIFICAQPGDMVLNDRLLFGRQAEHINYASIHIGDGPRTLEVFTDAHRRIAIPAGSGRASQAGFVRFAALGAEHLRHTPERLVLFLGLLLLAARWRDLGLVAAGLVAGYAIAIIAGLTGVVSLDRALAGAALGLLIAGLGAAALRARFAGPPGRVTLALLLASVVGAVTVFAALKSGPAGLAAGGLALAGTGLVWSAGAQRPWWLITGPAAAFGLLDGLNTVTELQVLSLPTPSLTPALLGHAAGVGGAALLLVSAAMALAWLVGRKAMFLRGPAVEIGGVALIGAGVFWFVSRLAS